MDQIGTLIEVYCTIEGHNNKNVESICFDTNCKSMRLCCSQCITESHVSHKEKLTTFHEFLYFIQYYIDQPVSFPDSYNYAQIQIIQELKIVLGFITMFQNQIKKELSCFSDDSLQLQIKKAFNMQQGQKYFEIETQYWTQNSIEGFIKYVEVNNGYISLKKQDKEQLKETDKNFINAIRQHQQNLEQINTNFYKSLQIYLFPTDVLGSQIVNQKTTIESQKIQFEQFPYKLSSEISDIQIMIDTKIADQVKLSEESNDNATFQQQLVFIQNKNLELIDKLKDYQKQVDNQREILEQQSNQIAQQQDLTQQQKETLEQCKNKIEKLKKEKQKAEIQLEQSKKLQQTLNDQLETINQLKVIINEQNMNKQDFIDVIEQLKTALKKSSDRQLILQLLLQDNNAQNEKLQRDFNLQEETINHLQDLANRNKIISNVPDEDKFIQKLEGQAKEINKNEEILRSNIADQAEQWQSTTQNYRISNETLLKKLDLKQKSVIKIKQQNWELVQEIEQYIAEIDKFKVSNGAQKDTIEQCKNAINKLKVENQNLQKQLIEHRLLSSKIEDQIGTITQLTEKIKKQSTTIADQSESIQQLKQKIQTQDEIILQKSTEIKTIRQNNQFIHEQEEYFILIQKIKKQSTTIADQSESIQQLKQQIQNQYEIIHKQEEYCISQIKTRVDSIIDLKIKVRQLELQLKNCKKCPYCNGIDQNYNEISQNNPLRFNKIPFELIGHQDSVTQAIISQDGALIVSSSNDNTIKIWNAKSKQILQTIQLTKGVQCMALSSNNQYLAYYFYEGEDSKVNLYHIKQNKHFGIANICNPIGLIESIVFSLDVKYLLFGGLDKKIIIWGMVDMKQVHIFETHYEIQMINISPDNKLISCLARFKGTIYIWDLYTKAKLIQENNVHSYGQCLCSSADSSIYVTSGVLDPVKIWKLNQLQDNKYSLTLTLQIEAGSKYVQALLTMDNQYIISMCNADGTIMIYERESGRLIQELCSGEKSGSTSSISMSNDMKVLVSTNSTNNIKVWTRE